MKISGTLPVLLYLIALHSFVVGLILVIIPVVLLDYFGYHQYHGSFFKVQGGVFHIVMGLVYFMAAWDMKRNWRLIYLVIIFKFVATIFLFSYYLFVDRIWMVAISGAGDLIMGLLVLFLFLRLLRYGNNYMTAP